jgi:hypothetical protein
MSDDSTRPIDQRIRDLAEDVEAANPEDMAGEDIQQIKEEWEDIHDDLMVKVCQHQDYTVESVDWNEDGDRQHLYAECGVCGQGKYVSIDWATLGESDE